MPTTLQFDECLYSRLYLHLDVIVVSSVLIEVETRCLVWDVVGGTHSLGNKLNKSCKC